MPSMLPIINIGSVRCQVNMAHIRLSKPWLSGSSPYNRLRCSLFQPRGAGEVPEWEHCWQGAVLRASLCVKRYLGAVGLPVDIGIVGALDAPPRRESHLRCVPPAHLGVYGLGLGVYRTTALCSSGEGYKTRRCRRVTYPESYITKYTSIR